MLFGDPPADTVAVTVSAKMCGLLFHGCDPDYISSVCHGRCCETAASNTGTFIQIAPAEEKQFQAMGATVLDGVLQNKPGEHKCTFKGADSLCTLHAAGTKPFGCVASPFTLSPTKVLIVRHRYKRLICYKAGENPKPAYIAFYSSLALLFGDSEAARIRKHLEAGGGNLQAYMRQDSYDLLMYRAAHTGGHVKDPGLLRGKKHHEKKRALKKLERGTPPLFDFVIPK